jgi:hypothetical protein
MALLLVKQGPSSEATPSGPHVTYGDGDGDGDVHSFNTSATALMAKMKSQRHRPSRCILDFYWPP